MNFIKQHFHSILVILIAFFFVGIGMVGTVYPYFTKPKDRGYMALQGFVDDYVGYVSYVKEGMYGRNTFRIRSIPPPQTPTTAQLILIWMGKIGGFLRWDAPFTFHFFRAFFGVFLIVTIYRFLLLLLKNKIYAVGATLLSATATSLGWWEKINGIWQYKTIATFWFINNDALRFVNRPHYLLGAVIFLFVSYIHIKWHGKAGNIWILGAFFSSLFLGTMHPTFAMLLGCVEGIFFFVTLIKTRNLRVFFTTYIASVAGLLIGVGLSYWSTHQYPYTWILSFEDYVKNDRLPIQAVFHDCIVFGPMLWFGIIGMIIELVRTRGKQMGVWYVFVWLVLQMAFFFWIYPFLRTERVRYIQSLYFIPMGYGTMLFLLWLKRLAGKFVAIGFFVLLNLSVASTLWQATVIGFYQTTDYKYYNYFIFPTKNMLDAYAWLDRNTPKESMVLASYEAANNIIMYSHNYVIGNKEGWPAGMGDAMERTKDDFLRGTWPESVAREYVMKNKIRYVYGGYQEGGDYIKYSFIVPVYKNPEVTIYKVNVGE